MKKQLMFIGILGVPLIILLSGCMSEQSKFIGTWQTQDGATSITFNNDNTAIIVGTGPLGLVALIGTFNYTLANQEITFSRGSLGITVQYSFPQSNELVLSNDQGTSIILMKQ